MTNKTCIICGELLTDQQQKRFRAKLAFGLKHHQHQPAGPFCGNKCRAQFVSNQAEARIEEAKKRLQLS